MTVEARYNKDFVSLWRQKYLFTCVASSRLHTMLHFHTFMNDFLLQYLHFLLRFLSVPLLMVYILFIKLYRPAISTKRTSLLQCKAMGSHPLKTLFYVFMKDPNVFSEVKENRLPHIKLHISMSILYID